MTHYSCEWCVQFPVLIPPLFAMPCMGFGDINIDITCKSVTYISCLSCICCSEMINLLVMTVKVVYMTAVVFCVVATVVVSVIL